MPDSYVLLNVEQTGSSPLDLRLVGTDGSLAFAGQIQQKTCNKLQSKNFDGTESEWQDVLLAVFLPGASTAEHAKDIELVATVVDQMTIVLRRDVGRITASLGLFHFRSQLIVRQSRLGAVNLQQNDDQEIELFDWTGRAASSTDELQQEVHRLRESLQEQKSVVATLTTQLDDLVEAKKVHESALIHKFAELLNNKKLKIRDQQRLLAHAKVDGNTAGRVQSSRAVDNGERAGASRVGKRKAVTKDDSEDEAEDKSGIAMAEGLGDSDRATTEDEDEDSNGEDFDPRPKASQVSQGRSKAWQASQASHASHASSKASLGQAKVDEAPPPRRQLPFGNSARPARAMDDEPTLPATRSRAAEEDEETDDDEL